MGGVPPYSFNWTDAAGTSVSTTSVATGLSAGTYTAEVTDGNGCVTTSTFTLLDGPVGIADEFNPIQMATYPNPTTGLFTLDINLDATTPLTITIFDMMGRKVLTENKRSTDTYHGTIDISS